MSQSMKTDNIHLRNIRLPLALRVGPDAWHRTEKTQPAIISVKIAYPSVLIAQAAEQDTVAQTLDYGKLYRKIEEKVRNDSQLPIHKLADVILRAGFDLVRETILTEATSGNEQEQKCIFEDWRRAMEADIWIHLPKAILRADQGLLYKAVYRPSGGDPEGPAEHEFTIEGIRCYCILGVNPHERREKQAVQVALTFSFVEGDVAKCNDFLASYQELTRSIAERVDSSSFQTVEALATLAAKVATYECGFPRATVRVEKPSAQPFVEYSGVEITRDASFFGTTQAE